MRTFVASPLISPIGWESNNQNGTYTPDNFSNSEVDINLLERRGFFLHQPMNNSVAFSRLILKGMTFSGRYFSFQPSSNNGRIMAIITKGSCRRFIRHNLSTAAFTCVTERFFLEFLVLSLTFL